MNDKLDGFALRWRAHIEQIEAAGRNLERVAAVEIPKIRAAVALLTARHPLRAWRNR